jgi:rubrerythrin
MNWRQIMGASQAQEARPQNPQNLQKANIEDIENTGERTLPPPGHPPEPTQGKRQAFDPSFWQERISDTQSRLGEAASPYALSWAEQHHQTLHWKARKSFQAIDKAYKSQDVHRLEEALRQYEKIHQDLFEACRKERDETHAEPETLSEVTCGTCDNFTPDTVNPGEGIGSCSLKRYPKAGQPSPWPMARRQCPAFLAKRNG